jgi:hypothetical protein
MAPCSWIAATRPRSLKADCLLVALGPEVGTTESPAPIAGTSAVSCFARRPPERSSYDISGRLSIGTGSIGSARGKRNTLE